MDNRSIPIITEQIFNSSIDTVWKAITEQDQMVQWFFEEIESFEPVVGFETKFNVTTPNRDYMHLWKLTEVVPGKKITYSWKYEGLPGDGIVIFELFPQNDQTLLKLTNLGLESFPEDIPEFTRESCIGGWKYFINDRLKEYLDKKV